MDQRDMNMVQPIDHQADVHDETIATYRRLIRRRVAVLVLLSLACLAGFLIDIATGPSGLGLVRTINGIIDPASLSRAEHVMVWNIRLPVAIMAILVGMALSLAGAELQTVLNNPLASPMTLGLSSAATFGAALAIVLGINIPGVPNALVVTANAFVFAFGTILVLQALARRAAGDRDTLILFGIGLLFTYNAGVALVQFLASADALQQFVFWGMGSLSRSNWLSVTVLGAVVLAMFPFSMRSAWRMTALRFGDDRASSFGVDVRRLRMLALPRISLLAATAVAFCGTIGFIGIVGPHIARMIIGEDHRFFLPASLLMGALVMTFSSIVSKSLMPGVIMPIGVITAFIGLPVFFLLVLRRGSVK